MRPRLGVALLIITVALVVACGSQQPDPVETFLATLDKATYKDCGAQRDAAARYLLTGQPPSLDAQYLDERTSMLRQPKDVQRAYIRQYVNSLVAQCDSMEQTAIESAKDQAAYQADCLRLGGTLATVASDGLTPSNRDPHIVFVGDGYAKGQCIVTYFVSELGQNLTYQIPLAVDGSMDRARYAHNQNVRCQGHPEDFHDDTGVCVVVGFIT